jgi:hypothetical protein
LREIGKFCDFVSEQAARDFAPDRNKDVGDTWFGELLPPRTPPSSHDTVLSDAVPGPRLSDDPGYLSGPRMSVRQRG